MASPRPSRLLLLLPALVACLACRDGSAPDLAGSAYALVAYAGAPLPVRLATVAVTAADGSAVPCTVDLLSMTVRFAPAAADSAVSRTEQRRVACADGRPDALPLQTHTGSWSRSGADLLMRFERSDELQDRYQGRLDGARLVVSRITRLDTGGRVFDTDSTELAFERRP